MVAQVGGERNHCVSKGCHSTEDVQEESKKAGCSGRKRKKKGEGTVQPT